MTIIETGPPSRKRVFIIHGHASSQKHALKKLIEDAGAEPVLMQDGATGSIAFIEKFEREAGSCAYAIALLTPDDLVHLQRKDGAPNYRARQNVVFEMGWFAGRLGRERVLMLHQRKAVELPSDLHGVEFVAFDATVTECEEEVRLHLVTAGIVTSKG